MADQSELGLGPCMRVLNERERAFVIASSEVGSGKGWRVEAAKIAGYSGTPNSLRVQAHRLATNPKVLAAMKEFALGLMHISSVRLTAMLLDIASGDIPSTAGEKLKAAAMVFNRIGMPETTEHKVSVTHDVDTASAMQKLTTFAKALNLDPKQLLGHINVDIVDGEFTEVVPAQLEDKTLDFSEFSV